MAPNIGDPRDPPRLPPPPPPLLDKSILSDRTLAYWEIMLLRRGRHPHKEFLSVGDALDGLRRIDDNTDPNRPLAILVGVLRHEIIEYGGSSRKITKKESPNGKKRR